MNLIDAILGLRKLGIGRSLSASEIDGIRIHGNANLTSFNHSRFPIAHDTDPSNRQGILVRQIGI